MNGVVWSIWLFMIMWRAGVLDRRRDPQYPRYLRSIQDITQYPRYLRSIQEIYEVSKLFTQLS